MQGFRDLKVYQKSFELAFEVFEVIKTFPDNEKSRLVDQLTRSSRAIPAIIAEAYRKRAYPKSFVSKLVDADGEATESQVWLDFALQLGYIDEVSYSGLIEKYEEVGRMLGGMINSPEKFSGR